MLCYLIASPAFFFENFWKSLQTPSLRLRSQNWIQQCIPEDNLYNSIVRYISCRNGNVVKRTVIPLSGLALPRLRSSEKTLRGSGTAVRCTFRVPTATGVLSGSTAENSTTSCSGPWWNRECRSFSCAIRYSLGHRCWTVVRRP